ALVLPIAIFGGLCIGLGVAAWRELSDRTFRSPEQVTERTPPSSLKRVTLGGTHVRILLCVGILLSIFLSIHLSVSGRPLFPYFAAFATSLALICLEWQRLSTGLIIAACLLLATTVFFFVLSIPYAVAPSRRLLSLAQLYVALVTNYGLFLGLTSL